MCIDLKSFYASVECVERGLDPRTTNLVVADASRMSTKNYNGHNEKAIALTVFSAMAFFINVNNMIQLFSTKMNILVISMKIFFEKIGFPNIHWIYNFAFFME